MVHKHRNASKATLAKDISPVRGGPVGYGKYAAEQQHGLGSRLAPAAVPARSLAGANADKWKWNSMVGQQREQFNSMHYC